jgi:hypothetical protein
MQRYFSFEKRFRKAKSDPEFSWRGVKIVIPMSGKKGSRTPFWLASF